MRRRLFAQLLLVNLIQFTHAPAGATGHIMQAISRSRGRCTSDRLRRWTRVATLVSAALGSFTSAEPLAGDQGRAPQSAQAGQSIDDVVTRSLTRTITPGAVVAVVLRDSVVFLKAYGRTGDSTAAPLSAAAVFQVGPVAELVTALAAARLAREGKVRLDEAVTTLLPELPPELGRATLAQLLTKTAGLAQQPVTPERGGADDLGAAARQLTKLDRVADPGTVYSTSPLSVALAGLVLERQAKQPYAQLMRATVLEPLGMTRSTFDFTKAQAQLTPGFTTSLSAVAPFQPVPARPQPAVQQPVGGLYTTASDLARLVAALMSDGVIRGERLWPEGVAGELLTAKVSVPASEVGIGLGTELVPWQSRPSLRIRGGASGHGVMLQLLLQERLGVIVLTNKSGATLDGVADFVFGRLLGVAETPRESAAPAPVDSTVLAELARYPGSYLNGRELIEIVVQEGRPFLKSDTLVLELKALPGGAVGALAQGQTVLAFRLLKDASGRPYLWLRQRAFGRREH